MSDEIDPELLARSRKKFSGFMGAKAEKKEPETKTARPHRVTVEELAEDEGMLERARNLREEMSKKGE